MDLLYDDLWSYKNCRISCSELKRVWGLTEVFLSLEKLQEALAARVSEDVEDGIERKKTNLRWPRS
jgi:hypothetical protein